MTAGSLALTPEFIPDNYATCSAASASSVAPAGAPVRPGSPGPVWRGRGQRRRAVEGAPNRRNRTLLATTKTDEAAIAAPAMSGLRNPAAASGIAAML